MPIFHRERGEPPFTVTFHKTFTRNGSDSLLAISRAKGFILICTLPPKYSNFRFHQWAELLLRLDCYIGWIWLMVVQFSLRPPQNPRDHGHSLHVVCPIHERALKSYNKTRVYACFIESKRQLALEIRQRKIICVFINRINCSSLYNIVNSILEQNERNRIFVLNMPRSWKSPFHMSSFSPGQFTTKKILIYMRNNH